MKVYSNAGHFILEVEKANKAAVASLMAYRGLTFSTSASTADKAVLFSSNPYALADLANGFCPELAPYKMNIEASRALDGLGTQHLPPGKELKHYQKGTFDYLFRRGGGLNADPPGAGKTPTSIAFCNAVNAHRVLVICPASVRLQWGVRIKEWSTIPMVKVSVMLKPKDGIHPTAHYQVLSYEAARNPAIIRALGKYEWDVLICDEAHRMKSVDTLTTRAVLGNNKGRYHHGEHDLPAIATHCNHKLALTGTPLLNRPSEAFTLIRYFDHEAIDFMGWEAFKAKYNPQAELRTLTGKRFKLENCNLEQELQNRLRTHLMARHEKKDIRDEMQELPRYNLVMVEEDGAVRQALDVEGMLEIDIDEIQTVKDIEVLGHIAEARRLMGEAIAPHVVAYAKEFLEDTDEKLTIFGWHISVLDILCEGLKDFGVVRIDGSKNSAQRQKSVDDFQNRADIRVFIGNIQSAGEGVDGLQNVCSRCYLAEPDWVPSRNEQAVSRLDRIGQEEIVQAEIFVAPGSLSEKILVRALEKMNVIHRVLDKKES